MTEIFTGLLLFIVLVGGLGLPVTATMALGPDERLCLGAAIGFVLVYLAAWIVYWLVLPLAFFWILPVAAVVAVALRRRALAALFNDGGTRRLTVLWLLVAAWCLGLLTLVRSYSGGEWVGDWFEHYQRALFFLQHQPLDTVFLLQYPLPARPPLANLTIGALMALTKPGFAQFQICTTLCGSLAFIPAAMLARRFRKTAGSDPAATLALLLMLCPLFVENTTFSWTKMETVFFTLTGLFLFLKAEDSKSHERTLGMALCLGAALLTHYSAGPYVVILGAVWCWRRRAGWTRQAFWREAIPPLAVTIILLSTWFMWATWNYGSATFLSNTTVTVGKGLSLSHQLAQKALNLFITLVPHPLRPADYIFVQQTSALSWWRDYFFNIYQTNLPLACGSGSLIAMGALVWRQRRALSVFWGGFILAAVLLNTLLIAGPDRWGTVHVCLQPVVLIALAWLAAGLPTLGRALKVILSVGLAVDFILGIALHFWVQHLVFSPHLFANHGGQQLIDLHGYATWNNFLAKISLHLGFLGDIAPPPILVCGLLAALLGLTACLAFKKAKPS